MLRRLTVLCALAALLNIITSASAQNAPVTDCDRLAANPDDPQRKAVSVAFDKIDTNAAIPACEAAVRQYPNDARLIFQLGRAFNAAKNYQAALEQYRKAADQGFAPAQTNLGNMYLNGLGVPKDDAQAVAWLRKAADQGVAQAQRVLGVKYELGEGVSRDLSQAVSWYRKAAEQGDEIAKKKLAELPSYDPDAKRDPDDVVAQVLNYSSLGNDDGAGGSYWYQDKSDKCRYKLFGQAGGADERQYD
jgi:tetratricopeptide (TPR) repeat protein